MTASRDLFIDDSSQKGSSKSSRLLFLIGLGALVVGIGSGIGIGWAIRGDSSDTAPEEITLEFDPFDFIDENTDNKTIQGWPWQPVCKEQAKGQVFHYRAQNQDRTCLDTW